MEKRSNGKNWTIKSTIYNKKYLTAEGLRLKTRMAKSLIVGNPTAKSLTAEIF